MDKEKIKQEMRKYSLNDFELYRAEAGWQYWMNGYTEADDDEPITESEAENIENIQAMMWEETHEI